MGRNFLVIYTAREGSSAIMARLSSNPNISVPLMEELDKFWIRKFYGTLDLAATFDAVFSTGAFDMPHTYARNNYLAPPRPVLDETTGQRRAVGFKWRPHGVTAALVKVLRRHEVVVFHLARQDFLELICSLHISSSEVGGQRLGHAQFAAARDEESRAKIRQTLNTLQVPASLFAMSGLALRRVGRALQHRLLVERLRRAGVRVLPLRYEAFNADPESFFRDMCARIDVEHTEDPDMLPRRQLSKVADVSAMDRVSGVDAPLVRTALGTFAKIYAWLIDIRPSA